MNAGGHCCKDGDIEIAIKNANVNLEKLQAEIDKTRESLSGMQAVKDERAKSQEVVLEVELVP
jgi:hypothetical protein